MEAVRLMAAWWFCRHGRDTVLAVDIVQGKEGREKYFGFPLLSYPTIAPQCLPWTTSCWKTIDGEAWETQATGVNLPVIQSRAEKKKGKEWIRADGLDLAPWWGVSLVNINPECKINSGKSIVPDTLYQECSIYIYTSHTYVRMTQRSHQEGCMQNWE